MAGLLGGFLNQLLGSAQPDPMQGLLGQYYDPAVEKQRTFGALLKGIGTGLVTPGKYSTGDMGTIARAGITGINAADAEGPAYMKEAMDRKTFADEQRDRNRYTEEDQNFMDFLSTLPQEQRDWAKADPKGFLDYYGRSKELELPGSGIDERWGTNPVRMMDENNNVFYRTFSNTGGTRVVPEVPGTKPIGQLKMIDTTSGKIGVDPYTGQQTEPIPGSRPGDITEQESAGRELGKGLGKSKLDAISFMQGFERKMNLIDQVDAEADRFAGMTPNKFAQVIKSPQEAYAWKQRVNALQAEATAATMAGTESLYPMSEADRSFLMGMATGGLDMWMDPKNFKQTTNILRQAYLNRAIRIRDGIEQLAPQIDLDKYITPDNTDEEKSILDEYGIGD